MHLNLVSQLINIILFLKTEYLKLNPLIFLKLRPKARSYQSYWAELK